MASSGPQYFRPRDWASAHELLARPDLQAKPLYISPRPVSLMEVQAGAWIDLSLLDIAYIRTDETKVRIGALANLQDLYISGVVQAQAGGILSQAAYLSATLGLRNLASIAGAILSRNGPQEILLSLLALEASLILQDPNLKRRMMPLAEYLAIGEKDRLAGEVIVEVSFDDASSTGYGGSLERVARTPRDHAIVAAAAVVKTKGNGIESLRLACAGASLQPKRLSVIENLFNGQRMSDKLLQKAEDLLYRQVEPIADYLGSVEYRRSAAVILCSRAMKNAWKRSTDG
jgi:xanthine dehydrogenase FAD-binding subunit